MIFKLKNKLIFCPRLIILLVLVFVLVLSLSSKMFAQEIFIYRPNPEKNALSQEKKITVHGEFFGHLLTPSTYLSFNDMSGSIDRWNFGFQNIVHFTPTTRFISQLVTHDDGDQRTKFDWHFSLRQTVFENLVFIIGHDSNHDSDHESQRSQKLYFLNRNYIGFGIPFETGNFYLEPFTWFFLNSNQRSHLDMSGENVKQEYGIRIGYWFENGLSLHGQILAQTDEMLAAGNTYMATVFMRIRIIKFLELSLGASLWKDTRESLLGNKDKFYKLMWGIVIPF